MALRLLDEELVSSVGRRLPARRLGPRRFGVRSRIIHGQDRAGGGQTNLILPAASRDVSHCHWCTEGGKHGGVALISSHNLKPETSKTKNNQDRGQGTQTAGVDKSDSTALFPRCSHGGVIPTQSLRYAPCSSAVPQLRPTRKVTPQRAAGNMGGRPIGPAAIARLRFRSGDEEERKPVLQMGDPGPDTSSARVAYEEEAFYEIFGRLTWWS
ncbi:hypothetical protein FB45DRAFT_877531 [Roridomyces roridus]|uniref:Uncharacterized protein n=1 Tax=Roridomyces roridus TaxID=1738132 RepID=A0AAD7B302_9AGAR|nr:hypothetical protein FB45DRAFT_877531 [Roridomyces roridus]